MLVFADHEVVHTSWSGSIRAQAHARTEFDEALVTSAEGGHPMRKAVRPQSVMNNGVRRETLSA